MNYTTLPEDLAPIQTARTHGGSALMVRISQGGVGLTRAAHEALGSPARLEILFGAQSRMAALRGVRAGGYSARKANGGAVQIMAPVVCRTLALGPPPEGRKSHAFPARLVEGALLIGPLPEVLS